LLTSGDLNDLDQPAEGLGWSESVFVEPKVNTLRQDSAWLDRIRAHKFEQDTLNADAVILKLLRIAVQEIGSYQSEKVINTVALFRH
jgi:hypothetical protein